MKKRLFGLIGFPLTHSFSKKYFTEKFKDLGLSETHEYELFEMEDSTHFLQLFKENPDLDGVNITIPHKQNVFDYLDDLDYSAKNVGAVNVVKKEGNRLIGYNSDFYGFQRSLTEFVGTSRLSEIKKALILGNGGAAKAILAALRDLDIEVQLVSRKKSDLAVDYKESDDLIDSHQLIINCTPLGTYPKEDTFPPINYSKLNSNHFLFDLVYNPSETLFLSKGKEQGASIKNGYDMLVYQAEKSWEIWNETK